MGKRKLHQINHQKFNYFSDENKTEQITDQKTLLKRFVDEEIVTIEKRKRNKLSRPKKIS